MYKENLLNCYFHCVFCIKIDNKWKYVRVCVQTTGTLYYTGIPHSLKQKKKNWNINLPAISLIFRNVMHFRMVTPGQQINSNNNSSRQHGNSSNHIQNEPLHHQLYNPLMQRKMCPQIGSNINKVTGNNNNNNNNNNKLDNNGSKMYSLLGSEYVAFLADWELTLSFKF